MAGTGEIEIKSRACDECSTLLTHTLLQYSVSNREQDPKSWLVPKKAKGVVDAKRRG